jgi:hypothetical protein
VKWAQVLHAISHNVDLLKVLIRLAEATRAITPKQYLEVQTLLQEIGKMGGDWLNFVAHQSAQCFLVRLLTEFPATSHTDVVVGIEAGVGPDNEARRLEAPNDGRTLLRTQSHWGHQHQGLHLSIGYQRLYCM